MLSIVVSIINSWDYCEFCIKYNRILYEEAILSVQLGSDPRDRKKYYMDNSPMRRLIFWLIRIFFDTVTVLKMEGRDNFPLDGPVIIAANHVTNFDAFPMQFAVPRAICYMGKAELFYTPLDLLLRVLCAFPVNRGEKDEWALRHARKILAHGQTLGMFPEGRRSKGNGLAVAKTGTARMAIEMNCPILPVTVVGTDQIFKRFPRRSALTIKVLSPILPTSNDTPLSLTDRLMFTLAAELPESMRGVYAEIPKGFGD
jgi:1-acyl-sn-glycerol-3-phosphate acyltransferase